jgi:hypothetical protein
LLPSVSRISENMGASTSRKHKGLHGLYRDNFPVSRQLLRQSFRSVGTVRIFAEIKPT